MSRPSRVLARSAVLAVLALALQSATCHAHFCSGDGCDDKDDQDEGTQPQMLVLPPLRDPLGRPITGPIPLLVRVRDR